MLKQSVFIRIFGNLKIKIWSYPKSVLKSLIIGLKRNSATCKRVTDMVCFKHCFDECCLSCNCVDKVEDICFRYSVNVNRCGKIYIPLEVIDCDSQCRNSFICELRTCTDNNARFASCSKSSDSCSSSPQCLLDLDSSECLRSRATNSPHQSSCNKKKNIDEIKVCYENIIRDILCSETDECKTEQIDKQCIVQLCLKYNLPYNEMICLLKELKCCKKPKSDCCRDFIKSCDDICCKKKSVKFPMNCQLLDDCEDDICEDDSLSRRMMGNNNRYICTKVSNSSPSCGKRSVLRCVRTPSPSKCFSCTDESECSPQISPDLCSEEFSRRSNCHNRARSNVRKSKAVSLDDLSSSNKNCQKDISEIKCILKDLVTIINSSDNSSCCPDPCDEDPCCPEPCCPDPCCPDPCCPRECDDGDCNKKDILNNIVKMLKVRRPRRKSLDMKCNKCDDCCKDPCAKPKCPDCCKDPCAKPKCKDCCKDPCAKPKCCKDPCAKPMKCCCPKQPKCCEKNPCCPESGSANMSIPLVDDDRNIIYRYLPDRIPVIPRKTEKDVFPTVDAYNCPPKENTCPDTICKEAMEKKNQEACKDVPKEPCDVVKKALEGAGVPKSISEQISRMSPSHGSPGITNIYYYVGGKGADDKSNLKSRVNNRPSEPDIIVEHQRAGEGADPYNHIVVDVNSATKITRKSSKDSKEDRSKSEVKS